MAQNKTQATRQKVSEFIAGIEDKQKRTDCRELIKMMREITGKRLDDIDRDGLTRLIRTSVDYMRETYPVD